MPPSSHRSPSSPRPRRRDPTERAQLGTSPGTLPSLASAAVIVLGGGIFAVGECLQGPTQQALIAELAPDHLRGRYMALSTSSWSIGWIAGPALGAFVLQQEPLALWPAAAALCLAAGAGGLRLERRLPETARRTPADLVAPIPPQPDSESA